MIQVVAKNSTLADMSNNLVILLECAWCLDFLLVVLVFLPQCKILTIQRDELAE